MNAAIREVEKAFPNIFKFHIYQDPVKTGRLEVTAYFNSKTDKENGILIHSKQESGNFIHTDYN